MKIKHAFDISWKLILVIVSCYLAIAFSIFVLRPVSVNYRDDETAGVKFSRFALRPLNDLFRNKILSTPFDWEEISIDSYNIQNDVLFTKLKNSTEARYDNWHTVDIASLNLADTEQSVILEPYSQDYQDKWTLVRCAKLKNGSEICQQNGIFLKNQIKTSVFRQETKYIGLDKDGKFYL
ncbi:MAG: hypothetical protein OHK0017_09730 [Patescibacteria group bacterium]